MVYTAPGWALLAGILAQHAALYRGISERSHPRLEPAGTTYDRAIEEISLPLPGGTSDRPPCQMTIVDHTFTSSMEQPYVAHFIPPIEQCPGPWDRVTLSFSSHVRGRQQDRVGGLWFDGVDVARFSTAQPNSNGIEWGFEKDLTAYQSLWQYPRPGQAEDKRHTVLVLRLDNEVDEVLTGAFGVNVKLTFWSKPLPSPLLSPSPMSVMLAPSETAVSLLGISPGQERLALPADPTVAPAVAPSTVAAATVAAAAATSSPAGDSVATKPTPAVVADANSAVAAPATTSSAASPSSSPSSEPSPVPDDLPPADLIEPLITAASKKDDARWTQLPMAAPVGRSVTVPERTSRAMLEIVPSAHGLEQTWFTEPPKAWGPLDRAAGGPVRTVEVWIDGVRHSTQPVFPAIAAGSINPLLWRPLACTGTFNAPTYWLDLSHVLVPGETHHVALQISSSRQHWLVSGNLHLWMDNTMQWIRVGHRGIVRGTAIPQAEFVTNETVSSSTSPEAHTIRITAEQNTSMTTSWIGVPSDAPPAVTRLIHTLAKKVASEPIFEMEDAPEDENQSSSNSNSNAIDTDDGSKPLSNAPVEHFGFVTKARLLPLVTDALDTNVAARAHKSADALRDLGLHAAGMLEESDQPVTSLVHRTVHTTHLWRTEDVQKFQTSGKGQSFEFRTVGERRTVDRNSAGHYREEVARYEWTVRTTLTRQRVDGADVIDTQVVVERVERHERRRSPGGALERVSSMHSLQTGAGILGSGAVASTGSGTQIYAARRGEHDCYFRQVAFNQRARNTDVLHTLCPEAMQSSSPSMHFFIPLSTGI